MKISFILYLCLQLYQNLKLNDGQQMKIDIDAEGKKSVEFKIDGQSIKIDLMRDKVVDDQPQIPQEVLDNQVEEFELEKKLDDNFEEEMKKQKISLDGLTEEEKQAEINNIKVKVLKDQNVPLDEAANFVKEHEGMDKFSIEQFSLNLQEFLERLRKELSLVYDSDDEDAKLDFPLILTLQDEMDAFLKEQNQIVKKDLQDENRHTHTNIIQHVTNIVDNLFAKLKKNEDNDTHDFELYYKYIDTLEKELKKVN